MLIGFLWQATVFCAVLSIRVSDLRSDLRVFSQGETLLFETLLFETLRERERASAISLVLFLTRGDIGRNSDERKVSCLSWRSRSLQNFSPGRGG
ncbi:MAG: hypothetical protein PUP91_14230 [Rhizonema sp. PD37]|nr:hypothetical protein [Rhizonema sp. PD37]